MYHGGNRKLAEFLANYGLQDENVTTRYNSKAAEYLRLQLRGLANDSPVNEAIPDYELGRE